MPDKLTPEAVVQAPDMTPHDVVDKAALLQELAHLDRIAYDQRRKETAELLGCRVESLDYEVARQRPHAEEQQDRLQGRPITVPETLPCGDPVDGPTLVQEMVDLLKTYVAAEEWVFPTVALWVLHTYLLDIFTITPRLRIVSPKEECGKSVLAALIRSLSYKAVGTGNTTPAALFRTLALGLATTAVLDEGDNLNWKDENLLAVLNAGYIKSQAAVWRTVGDQLEPREFVIWAALVIPSIGRVKRTVESRAIVIPMQRYKNAESIQDFYTAEQDGQVQPVTDTLRQKAMRWIQDHHTTLQRHKPLLPQGLQGRKANNWSALLTLADVIGDPWPHKARKALQHALTLAQEQDDDTKTLLLKDIKTLFEERKTDRLASGDLIDALHNIEDRPWPEYGTHRKPISTHQVAALLKEFDIKSKSVRDGTEVFRGYLLQQFQDAFDRYLRPFALPDADSPAPLPKPPSQSVTPLQSSNGAEFHTFHPVTPQASVTETKSRNPASDHECNAVIDQRGGGADGAPKA